MAHGDAEEEKIEISLRPVTFDEYIGQEHLKNNPGAFGAGSDG